jgi:hypothetical protein
LGGGFVRRTEADGATSDEASRSSASPASTATGSADAKSGALDGAADALTATESRGVMTAPLGLDFSRLRTRAPRPAVTERATKKATTTPSTLRERRATVLLEGGGFSAASVPRIEVSGTRAEMGSVSCRTM